MIEIFFASGFTALAIFLGLFLTLKFSILAHRFSHLLVPIGAGILLGVVTFHLFPEILDQGGDEHVFSWVLFGFLTLYILEHFMAIHACKEDHHADKVCLASSKVASMGFIFHSFLDGLALGAGFGVSNSLGVAMAIALFVHKLPVGILMSCIFLRGKAERKQVILWTSFVAMATPVGAILTYAFLQKIEGGLLKILLEISVGSFLYIAMSDLIPETRKKKNVLNIAFVLAGILLMFGLHELLEILSLEG